MGIRAEGYCKPNPAVYDKFIQPLFPEESKQKILMVGDTQTDLYFAQNIAVKACWARYGHHDLNCQVLNPRYIIDQLSELEAIIFGNHHGLRAL